MNNRTKYTAYLLLLIISLGWLESVVAKSPKVQVEQAIPGDAEQGQQNLPVKSQVCSKSQVLINNLLVQLFMSALSSQFQQLLQLAGDTT